MPVTFTSHEIDFNLKNKNKIRNWIKRIIKENKKNDGSISYIFTSEDYILKINNDYLKHNFFTDIITFDYSQNDMVEGDIFVSVETVLTNSEKFHTSFEEELLRVLIHGIFHLLGFKDKTSEQKHSMRALEDKALLFFKNLNE